MLSEKVSPLRTLNTPNIKGIVYRQLLRHCNPCKGIAIFINSSKQHLNRIWIERIPQTGEPVISAISS